MSPKFYSYLWVFYSALVGVMWLAGVLTTLAVIVFGFVAYGMVFVGMMCVLPATVSHPAPKKIKLPTQNKAVEPAAKKPAQGVGAFSTYRSA